MRVMKSAAFLRQIDLIMPIGRREVSNAMLEVLAHLEAKKTSCSIVNEANLTGGEIVGGTSVDSASELSAVGDDDGGDEESDPDRRRLTRSKHATPTAPVANALPPDGFVRLPQVLAVIPVSKSTWWAGCKSGRYPQSVKLGPRTTAWRVSDIRKLIQSA